MVNTTDFDALIAGRCAEPHRLLGIHQQGETLVVRAFLPGAQRMTVELCDGIDLHREMSLVHPGGLFEATLPLRALEASAARTRCRYWLLAETSEGLRRYRDPYAFDSLLGSLDLHLAGEGNHTEIYQHLGAHPTEVHDVSGTSFAVWAPSALRVSVVGKFNSWDGVRHPMRRSSGGVWDLFIPGLGSGEIYKYEILTKSGPIMKADPYAQSSELRPNSASVVSQLRYRMTDDAWLAQRARTDSQRAPISVYEVHLGSWRRARRTGDQTVPPTDAYDKKKHRRWLSYRELADTLVDYVAGLGFTHIELLPVMEHPFDGSWGYQVTGYYAPTRRFGDPDDFRYFVDRCHKAGLGVILDWVPAHFPKDAFGLGRFDGAALYEHPDPRRGEHLQWDTYIFDFGRNEVRNFLIANALYWFEEFHIDGLRVDAVASLLYLDYSAAGTGDWLPNEHGGRENLEAIALIRELNDRVHRRFPGALMIAEESTTWPGVTRPTYLGGLGFDFKWNMGWMHDTLDYFSFDPIHRNFHHNLITFGLTYAFSERFVLPFSHDEVVHLKQSLVSKMPGDRWKMMANLRALYAHMWAHPGKKLLFMGGEFAQWHEWDFGSELDWHLADEPDHAGVQMLVSDLNRLYRQTPALHEVDDSEDGFRWIDANDSTQSTASFIRYPAGPDAGRAKRGVHVICVGSYTPVLRRKYRLGVPRRCRYLEILNTDAEVYGGGGQGNLGVVDWEAVPSHGFAQSVVLTLPPLSMTWLIPEDAEGPDEAEPVNEVNKLDGRPRNPRKAPATPEDDKPR